LKQNMDTPRHIGAFPRTVFATPAVQNLIVCVVHTDFGARNSMFLIAAEHASLSAYRCKSVISGAFMMGLLIDSMAYRLVLCSRAPLSSWLASHLVVSSWPARAGVFQMNSLALPSGISRSIDVIRATNAVFVTAYQRLFVTGDGDLAIVVLFSPAVVSGSADLR